METLIKYFLSEVEHTWRMKFQDIKDNLFDGKKCVEQIIIIADMKELTQENLSNI